MQVDGERIYKINEKGQIKSESSGAFLFLFNMCSVFRANQYGTERKKCPALCRAISTRHLNVCS